MKTRLTMFAMLLCAALTFTACGADYSTPEATMNAFCTAMNNEDVEAMADCMVKDEKQKALEEWNRAKEKSEGKEDEKKFTASFKKVEKDGDWTIGIYEIKEEGKDKGIEMKQVLVEEDGAWKLSDKKSAEYMSEKMKEAFGGGDGDESTGG